VSPGYSASGKELRGALVVGRQLSGTDHHLDPLPQQALRPPSTPQSRAGIIVSVSRRWASSEESRLARTTAKTVLQLRKLYAKGDLTQAMLAERFGLSLSNVKSILGWRSWKNI
jgi:hypothetical protein